MQCPKCSGFMERLTHGPNIVVERCSECMGLFCMPDVLAEMKTAWMSEMVDLGNPRLGKKYDAVGDIACPCCQVAMAKKNDPRQVHVWFEQCDRCGGVFFDAGEFSDWKYETWVDKVRDLWKGDRYGE